MFGKKCIDAFRWNRKTVIFMHETELTRTLPFISSGIPSIGGGVIDGPDSFNVEEVPLYEPSGVGEHIYLHITRRGWSTRDIQKRLSAILNVHESAVGYAGLKDKNAVVTQTFSLHIVSPTEDEMVAEKVKEIPEVQLLWQKRHGNKLRLGHLKENKFIIRLSGTAPDALELAGRTRAFLEQTGMPNYYGFQRFGSKGDNPEKGRDVISGKYRPGKWLRKLLLSSYQSELFNRYLASRINRGYFTELLQGDLAKKTESGGLFEVIELDRERGRFESNEICYTGPMFGKKMPLPQGVPGEMEEEILREENIKREDFDRAGLDGSRRPGRIMLDSVKIEALDGGLEFRFSLPPGSYATSLLREFVKDEINYSGS